MTTEIRNLTQDWISNYPTPPETVSYRDAKQDGLRLRISTSGAKTWGVYAWDRSSGKPRKQSIGPWRSWPVAAAPEPRRGQYWLAGTVPKAHKRQGARL
jgi:hypothetical protein